jgi:2-amino-4-hydroxy-6-hydroxymethyldihydropteridine diphosphokinase
VARAFVGAGSNMKPAENLRKALMLLAREMTVKAVSTVYETEAEGHPEQPRYYNCVVEVDTQTEPLELKRRLREIEERLGRVRTADRYASRTIDLDLLLYDGLSIETKGLALPDPEIGKRGYLAAGLAELAPDLTPPGMDERLSGVAMRASTQGRRALDEYTSALRREVLREG